MSDTTIVPADQTLPNKLRLMALSGRPIFPGIFTPFMISSAEDIKLVEECYADDAMIGIVMQKNDVENPQISDLYRVGTAARIIKKINLPDGGLNVFISTVKRFKIRRTLKKQDPMTATVDYLEDEEDDSFMIKALTRTLLSEMKDVSENNPLFSEEMRLNMVNIEQSGKIADFAASVLNIEKEDQQRLLEMTNVRRRIESVLVFIKKEQEVFKIQKKIQGELNERVEKQQREYFLREEMKSIKEELGEGPSSKESDFEKLKQKIEELDMNKEAEESALNELSKLELMDPQSSEYFTTRNYLDVMTSLPWEDESVEKFRLDEAQKILDEDHYGLNDVKKRIIEYLAVRKIKNDSKGSIILLVGPPGVGKTSVGRSIAKAMNKPFYRFSVGGMRDEAEIKGHRRTYVGAMPGKIIQGLKTTKSHNPVFMIDEVDKMGSSHQGDPASALLEVLDPEQNSAFRDYYLDVPFDLSGIVFILTANTLETIPGPLRDRVEIIRLSGYIDEEKYEIARKYLIPKSLKKTGLKKGQVVYHKKELMIIANRYAREAGVRNFEKNLDKIHRKYAVELVKKDGVEEQIQKVDMLYEEAADEVNIEAFGAHLQNLAEKTEGDAGQTKAFMDDLEDLSSNNRIDFEKLRKEFKLEPDTKKAEAAEDALNALLDEKLAITPELIEKYLGKPLFDPEDDRKIADRAGTAIGLAWTSMGGDTLMLEAIDVPGKEGLRLTGQLGDVMKESATIAMSWVRSYAIKHKIKPLSFFQKNTIHMHIPEGATPKDGPSAGITMVVTLMSLLMHKKIKKNLAMTGELSLIGNVLPIGGLKEKTVAAKRNKIKTVIIPKQNERDLEDIPEHVKKGIEFKPVSRIEQVLEIAF